MIEYYFAYGSNMNPERMKARGVSFKQALAGSLSGFSLRFNKRAVGKSQVGYANIIYAKNNNVEGVLYQLNNPNDISLMDSFEGNPVRYSREVFLVSTQEGIKNSWVYIANSAMIAENLLPEKIYLNHLLAGKNWHSDEYHQWLQRHEIIDNSEAAKNSTLNGLTHNV
jgi:gamma-glutamylcyclotransferase (GGCT)/AIG2-like uncharacterized protein YtfP